MSQRKKQSPSLNSAESLNRRTLLKGSIGVVGMSLLGCEDDPSSSQDYRSMTDSFLGGSEGGKGKR